MDYKVNNCSSDCTDTDCSKKEDFALVSDPSTGKRDTQASFPMFLLLQFVIDKMWVTTGLCNRIPGVSQWLGHSKTQCKDAVMLVISTIF